jgi:hypothetical protein
MAGVMERLEIDPDTGFVISVLDDDAPSTSEYSSGEGQTTDLSQLVSKGAKQVAPQREVSVNEEGVVASNNSKQVRQGQNDFPKHVVSGSSITQPKRQPTTTTKVPQNALDGSLYAYLKVMNPNKRVRINSVDGLVYFHLRKGSLKENIIALLEVTRAEPPIMSDISDNHEVPASVWISGETVLNVLDAILVSYNHPYPIWAEPAANRIVEVKYDRKRIMGD